RSEQLGSPLSASRCRISCPSANKARAAAACVIVPSVPAPWSPWWSSVLLTAGMVSHQPIGAAAPARTRTARPPSGSPRTPPSPHHSCTGGAGEVLRLAVALQRPHQHGRRVALRVQLVE